MGNEKIIEAIGMLGGPAKAARALGVSVQAVCFWRDGERQFPPALCISVEKLTDGHVRCEDIRPDIDWAYLRNNNGQPAHA
jgi:DNA-binding transcriptional regulator YdaS (Cro superfamily)